MLLFDQAAAIGEGVWGTDLRGEGRRSTRPDDIVKGVTRFSLHI